MILMFLLDGIVKSNSIYFLSNRVQAAEDGWHIQPKCI